MRLVSRLGMISQRSARSDACEPILLGVLCVLCVRPQVTRDVAES
jgi:hypothetical protein